MKTLFIILFTLFFNGCNNNPVSVEEKTDCHIYHRDRLIDLCSDYEKIPAEPVKF